jgi:hypothetical protein
MAKDPAMLWYWSDWHSGTITLSRFLKGCYMDVLHAQFNSGHLTLEEIKTVLGSDFGTAWPTLLKKFKVDDTGKFFNERLEEEQLKRAAFTASRRKNLESSHMDTHMVVHTAPRMEDRDRNENLLKEKSEKNVSRGTEELIPLPFNSDAFTFAWNEWNDYRRESRKKLTASTARKQLSKLARLSRQQEHIAIDIINQSIENGWSGLFEIGNNKHKNGRAATKRTSDAIISGGEDFGTFG